MTEALVLGKFLPPHLGHLHLIGFAERFADLARVVVEELPGEPIPVELRAAWLSELCPRAEVLILRDQNPQAPDEHPEFWAIWRASLLRLLGRAPSYVVASESYGTRLALELGARFIPVDPGRAAVDISATQIRAAPLDHFQYLPPPVRAHYALRVRIVGPESTGKSTLAQRLGAHFGTCHAPEYAERMLAALPQPKQAANSNSAHPGGADSSNFGLSQELLVDFARGQLATEDSLARQAHRLLFCDTCALTTAVWSELLHGAPNPHLLELSAERQYALTLLCLPDVSYADDVHRLSEGTRAPFMRLLERRLVSTPETVIPIGGDWEQRFDDAVSAVNQLLAGQLGAR